MLQFLRLWDNDSDISILSLWVQYCLCVSDVTDVGWILPLWFRSCLYDIAHKALERGLKFDGSQMEYDTGNWWECIGESLAEIEADDERWAQWKRHQRRWIVSVAADRDRTWLCMCLSGLSSPDCPTNPLVWEPRWKNWEVLVQAWLMLSTHPCEMSLLTCMLEMGH